MIKHLQGVPAPAAVTRDVQMQLRMRPISALLSPVQVGTSTGLSGLVWEETGKYLLSGWPNGFEHRANLVGAFLTTEITWQIDWYNNDYAQVPDVYFDATGATVVLPDPIQTGLLIIYAISIDEVYSTFAKMAIFGI